MHQIDAAIDQRVARREQCGMGSEGSVDMEGPGLRRRLTDIQADADLAGRPITMALQLVAAPVQPDERIGGVQPQPGQLLDPCSLEFEQAVERRVAILAEATWRRRAPRPKQPAREPGMNVGAEETRQRRVDEFANDDVAILLEGS